MSYDLVLALPRLQLKLDSRWPSGGKRVLAGLFELAASVMCGIADASLRRGRPIAAVSRIRGTGRGIHFGDIVAELDAEFPLRLESPFEGSVRVAGAVWTGEEVLGSCLHDAALAKLRWAAGADDLPIHVHDHSDRVIIVLEGRGYFHVTDQAFDTFDGQNVRSVPARERDVFAFTRGLLHTFSTEGHPMTLLSCQLPYLAFSDPAQYRIPRHRWIAKENPEPDPPTVVVDASWNLYAGGC